MKRTAMLLVVACLLGASMAPVAKAGEWDQKTRLTFSEPVELPGIILPAGSYIFRLLKSPVERNIVQVLSPDQTKVFATINAIPKYRPDTAGRPSIVYEERGSGAPRAIKEWYFPGRNVGHEFIYPSAGPTALARTEGANDLKTAAGSLEQPCPEVEPTVEQTMVSDESSYMHWLQQRQSGAPDTEAAEYAELSAQPEGTSYSELLHQRQTEPLELARADESDQATAVRELPRTGSLLPFTGLLGIAFLAAAFGVRLFSRRSS